MSARTGEQTFTIFLAVWTIFEQFPLVILRGGWETGKEPQIFLVGGFAKNFQIFCLTFFYIDQLDFPSSPKNRKKSLL